MSLMALCAATAGKYAAKKDITIMTDRPEKRRSEYALIQLLPNMMTIAAICAGLSAIRFGVQGNYTLAVQLILAAAILDGFDGRLARILRSDSKMGAELDSLADFLNFGVASPLVIYYWALQDMRGLGWLAVLVFSVCCVVRLARFNVSTKSEEKVAAKSIYFVGVPSPAGALLAMLPMFISFAFADAPVIPDVLICIHMVVIGLLMISHVPTWSLKAVKISRENVKYFLVGFAFAGAAVLIYAWITLVILCLGYAAMVAWGLVRRKTPEDGV
ncbi:CDP-diacylglycerol--serine O-phosphatidyltransferase [Ruegeria sp. R11]|jgi:CDP-diacylglycerol--serine O-phosphatidyltransferase|nr:CDP-diacylglycerol--serine O-phosphatidyltransferase [Ruegeria sp. R11]